MAAMALSSVGLGLVAQRPAKPTLLPRKPAAVTAARQRSALVHRASEKAESFPDGRTDLGNLAAAGAFAAHHYGKLHVDRTLILKAFAVLALGNAVINLLKRTGSTYDHVATVAAPAVLAIFVLNLQVSFLDATTALLGWRLAETSEGAVSSFEHLVFWGTIASMAAALYYNYGTLWYVIAFSVINLLRLFGVRGSKASGPLFSIPALVISAWALYSERHYLWALLLYLAQILRSGYMCVENLASKVDA